MSTPMVAGTLALIWEKFPNMTAREVEMELKVIFWLFPSQAGSLELVYPIHTSTTAPKRVRVPVHGLRDGWRLELLRKLFFVRFV